MGAFVRWTQQAYHVRQNFDGTFKYHNFAEKRLIVINQKLQETLMQELSRDVQYGLRQCIKVAQYLLKVVSSHIHGVMNNYDQIVRCNILKPQPPGIFSSVLPDTALGTFIENYIIIYNICQWQSA